MRGAWPLEVADERLGNSPGIFVAVGVAHTALVTADGNLWTFGAGEDGQLGHYNWESRRQPTLIRVSSPSPLVPALESPKRFTSQDSLSPNFSPPAPIQATGLGGARVVMVACGEGHTAAVTAAGGLWVWGRGVEGQLGLSSVQRLNVPTLVDPLLIAGASVAMVACGRSHTAAVTGSGSLWTWGLGEHGQLGHGSRATLRAPMEVDSELLGGRAILMVSCGDSHSGAVAEGGGVYMWGAGAKGRLGLGDLESRLAPCQIKLSAFTRGAAGGGGGAPARGVMVSCGGAHTACVTMDEGGARQLWAWGWNKYGQCGVPVRDDLKAPFRLEREALGGGDVVFVCCGQAHTAAITLVERGGGRGQAGGGKVRGGVGGVSGVEGGGRSEAVEDAVTSVLWSWGKGGAGQLGFGSDADAGVPAPVTGACMCRRVCVSICVRACIRARARACVRVST